MSGAAVSLPVPGAWRSLPRRVDEACTGWFDRAFAPSANPWRHLGALAFLCLFITIATGIIAFALYDTSVAGAYQSGRRLQDDPLLLGRLLRGLHRYAADAFMLLSVLHLVREAARGHFRTVRAFPWLTGVPLLWLLWAAGISGLWLLWDERALYSVVATAEWLQALPAFGEELARNFLAPGALNDRFFSLVLFVHIGVPLLLAGGSWIHVQRLSRVRMFPPRALLWGTLATFAALSLAVPAVSLGPADLFRMPAALSLDWFYQFPHPLVAAINAGPAWALVGLGTVALFLVPLLPARRARPAPAVVELANCNGCARCVADCPFNAIRMVARTDGKRHPRQAEVIAERCAACGICVGACPSSTPFRHDERPVSGIELPPQPIADLRGELDRALAALDPAAGRIVVFGCAQAADHAGLRDAGTAVVALECVAMVPPSFIEYALRRGADGVVLAGCREGDCEYRLGDQWVAERVAGTRAPWLRTSVPRERVALAWAGGDIVRLSATISALRARAAASAANPRPTTVSLTAAPEVFHD